jgi:predicted amidohydrolase
MHQAFLYAAVQSISIKGDIPRNVKRHVELVKQAAGHAARFALFPELSLTGYELAIARENAVTCDDPRLEPLRTQARELGITIVAGAPFAGEHGVLHIAALSFLPDGRLDIYCKQHLHSGENEVFSPGSGGGLLDIGEEKLALAVCADISHAGHPRAAAASGASIYAASVLISPKGYEVDAGLLKQYALEHGMPVVMANHGGPTGGWESAGRSAVWDAEGNLVASATGTGEYIVLAGRESGRWRGEVIAADR